MTGDLVIMPHTKPHVVIKALFLFFPPVRDKGGGKERREDELRERVVERVERKSARRNAHDGVDKDGGSNDDDDDDDDDGGGVVRASSTRELYLNAVRVAWRSQATRVPCPSPLPLLPPIVFGETVLRTDRGRFARRGAEPPSTSSPRVDAEHHVAVINQTDGRWIRIVIDRQEKNGIIDVQRAANHDRLTRLCCAPIKRFETQFGRKNLPSDLTDRNAKSIKEEEKEDNDKNKIMHKIMVMAAVQKAHNYHNNSNAPRDASSAQSEYNDSSSTDSKNDHFDTDLHGNVNILLGGAIISGVIMMVVLICYCCHKNVRKHRPQEYSHYWRTEPDVHSLEVFTMDTHAMQCLERSAGTQTHQEEAVPVSLPPCPVTSGPPPAYESLIFDPRALLSPIDKKDESDDSGIILSSVGNLPSESEANKINKREDIPSNDQDLPSYEAALKLEADGYV